jgi:hypothetical protein
MIEAGRVRRMRGDATTLPPLLRRYWLAMALLTALSILYTASVALRYHLKFPYGIGMLYGDSLWGDLLVFRPGFIHFGTPQFWSSFEYPFTYPAPLAVVLGVLFRLGHPVKIYLVIETAAIAAAAWWFVRQLTKRGISAGIASAFTLSCLAMTWPLLFLIDTANAEGFVIIALALGVYAVLRKRWWLGAALIGIAGSMKFFPLILLGLLLARRRYVEFAGGIVVAAIVTVASLAVLGPSVVEAQRHIDAGFALIQSLYLYTMKPDAAALDHSLWVGVRYAAVYGDRLLHPAAAARTAAVLAISLRAYLIVTAIAGLTLFFARMRRMPTLNIVLALTICAVLLPPLSLEYTLVHLLLPFALLCAYATDMGQQGVAVEGLGACFGCFVIIFNIETFLTNRFFYAAEARTLALVVLLVLVLRHRFPWAALDTACIERTATA